MLGNYRTTAVQNTHTNFMQIFYSIKTINKWVADFQDKNIKGIQAVATPPELKNISLAHSRAIGNASVADSFSLAWLLVVILSPEWKPSACSVFKRDAVDCSDAMRSGEVSAQSQSPLRRCVFCWIFFLLYILFLFSLPPPSLSLVFRGWTTSQDVYGGRRSSQRTCVVI